MTKTKAKYWYLTVVLLLALVVNENIVQWALAVFIGGYSAVDGLEEAFRHFSVFGYFFFTAFRSIPYMGLGVSLLVLSNGRMSAYAHSVFVGGLVGVLVMILWGLWVAQRPYYTDERVSSTTALAFLFIPIYAIPTGAAGAVLASFVYWVFRSSGEDPTQGRSDPR